MVLCPICKAKASFTKSGKLLCSSSVCETNTNIKAVKSPTTKEKTAKVTMPICVLDVSDIRLVGVNKRYCNSTYNLSPEYREQKDKKEGLASKVMWDREPLMGDVWIKLEVATSKDIDGIIKPVLDILQDCCVYDNDSQITELKISKVKIGSKKLESLKVWVCEV